MSKKQLNNRLESLFSGFEDQESPTPIPAMPKQEGWNWECDRNGYYISCGPEVLDVLGLDAQSFINHSIYSYSLSNGSSKSIKSILEQGIFPCETELDFTAMSGEIVTIRMNVFKTIGENGGITGWHGFNQVINRRKATQLNQQAKKITPAVPAEESIAPKVTCQIEKIADATPEISTVRTIEDAGLKKSPFNAPSGDLIAKKMSIPFKMGPGQALIEVISTKDQRRWRNDEKLLAEEVARQLAQAMENARLYQEVRLALSALEHRERYQANVARAVALLSEKGSAAVPEVLEALGTASDSGRVVFMERRVTGNDTFWQGVGIWSNSNLSLTLPTPSSEPIACAFTHWEKELLTRGWAYNTRRNAPSPEKECLETHNVSSALLLAVNVSQDRLCFIAFQDFGAERNWKNDEIDILMIVSNAMTNAFNRESLLSQLQVSLEESETLYNSSHHLALANDPQEMVLSITESLTSQAFNRAVLLLFEVDIQGKFNRIRVEANWYSGNGTPPAAIGTEFPAAVYNRLFSNATPKFYADIYATEVEPPLRDIFAQQNTRSAAVLPLWTSKRQIGVFLLLSDEKHTFSEQEIRTYPPLVDQLASAIENMRLFQQTQKALSETGLLYQISDGITQASDTPELVRLVAQHLLPKNTEAASIFLAEYGQDERISELELAGFTYSNGHYQPAGVHIPISALPFVNTLKSDPLVIPDVLHSTLDPVSQKSLRQINILSACIIPLLSAGKLVGILVTSASKPGEFAPEEVRLVQIAGGGIAVALEKQRLLRAAQRRALELQTAAEIARDTTSTLSLEPLINRIVTLLSDQFGYYHVAIYLVDNHSNYAIFKEGTGDVGKTLKSQGYRIPIGSRSIIGNACATGKPFIVNNVTQEPLYLPHPLLPETRSEMGLPLRISNRVIGVLDIQTSQIGVFDPDEISVLQILTDQISVAIENAQAYELSQKALADMKEVDRLKSQFLANMSHELRTPLNSIIGFSRVILKGIDGPVNETQQQDLSAIYNSGQHLLSLITDILDLSKIEAGKMELQFADVNICDLVNSAMSTAVGLVKDKPIKLIHYIPPDLPAVRADATRIRQVMINFISNASKFTDQGSISVEASVVENQGQQAEMMITVTDTGAGIALADQSKLFQPFSQVDDSPTRKTGGTGLGLSISRSLIEMHGGKIGLLKSEVGKGSTFFFTLPLKKEEKTLILEQPTRDNVILSIDDDLQVISLYERYLKPQGYQVVPLTNPNLAVQTARAVKPYAITLDVMMPETDGWQVLQNLKNDPLTRDIPVIMCTILEEEEKGFNLGASEYLVKPFLQEDLTATINRLNKDGKISDILVVDDDSDDRRFLEKMLRASGKFNVLLAENGVRGWELIQTKKLDAVILDLYMPDLDGFSILAKIRDTAALAHLPVIVLSGADVTAEQQKQLVEAGHLLLEKGMLREQALLDKLDTALRSISK